MTHARVVLEVARWEFHRFFNLRQQVVSLVLALAIAAVSYGVSKWVRSGRTPTIAAVNAPAALFAAPSIGVRIVPARDLREADVRRDVEAKKLEGALVFAGPDAVTLLVRGTPGWIRPLEEWITAVRRQQRLLDANMEPAAVERLFGRVGFQVEQVGHARAASRADRVAAFTACMLMMMGIWIGLGYMFVGITGEKQTRVTEQVVSAISAQAWMDGKILGLSAVAAASTAGYVVSALLLVAAGRLADIAVPLPTAFGTPAAILVLALLAVLGFAFWNTFIAAIAAVINDPHSSNRGGFLMLPAVPVAIALMSMNRPDAVPVRVLSMFPPTASPIMLMRLAIGSIVWWEPVVAIALLGGATWVMRLVAGRIFRTSLLLYGKEPSWVEVWRWARTE